MKNFFMLIFTAALTFGFVLGDLMPANAQSDEFTLEEITVTAQKREENQQKVPIAMEVVPLEEIKDFGKNDLDEILSTISAAVVMRAEDGLRVSIHGVTDYSDAGSGGQPSATPTVAVNIDGVTSNRKDTGSGLFDLERVEVLIGPQSTLYATQSTGGIINVVTASPKLDSYEVSGTLEYGNYDHFHSEGAVNAPISDTMAIRAAFTSVIRDGYLSNGGDNEDSRAGRIRALYQPNDRMSFMATAELSREGGSGYNGGVWEFVNQDDTDNPWTGEEVNYLGVNDQTRKKIYLNMEFDLGFGLLTVLPSYMTGTGYKENVRENDTQYLWQRHRDEGAEVHLNSPGDSSIQWIVGYIEYHGLDRNLRQTLEYVNTGVGEWSYRDMKETQRAVYANITYPVTDSIRLNAGIRKSHGHAYDMIQKWERPVAGSDPVEYAPGGSLQIMEAPDRPDYKFGIEYDMGENSMVYANYNTAYRLQGQYSIYNKPEELTAYTIGSKNRFLGNKLQLNGSAYYYDYKNFLGRRVISVWMYDLNGDMKQSDMFGPESVGEPNDAGQGDGRMYGADLQFNAILTQNDKVDMSASYVKSEWTNLAFDFFYEEQLAYDEETDSLIWVPTLDDQDYRGLPMIMAPEWTINLNYSHSFNLQNGGVLSARLETVYSSGYKITWKLEDYPYNYQEAHHMENASVVYTHPDGNWTLTGYIRNIGNYAEKRMYRSASSDRGYMTIGPPRTYGAVLSIKY